MSPFALGYIHGRIHCSALSDAYTKVEYKRFIYVFALIKMFDLNVKYCEKANMCVYITFCGKNVCAIFLFVKRI